MDEQRERGRDGSLQHAAHVPDLGVAGVGLEVVLGYEGDGSVGDFGLEVGWVVLRGFVNMCICPSRIAHLPMRLCVSAASTHDR